MSDEQRFRDKQWSQIVALAWADQEFKNRLMTSPGAVLHEYGLEAGADVQVEVVEDTAYVGTFVLPPSPDAELSEEELTSVGVAACYCGASGYCGGCRQCGCGRCGCGCGCIS